MMLRIMGLALIISLVFSGSLSAQHNHSNHEHPVSGIEAQPLMAHALRLREALSFLGSELAMEDQQAIEKLQHLPHDRHLIDRIQKILDPYCLARVEINPESRVKVFKGKAPAVLIQGGWSSFLVKVNNDAGVTAELKPISPNSLLPYHQTSNAPKVKPEDTISRGQSANRFLDIQPYTGRPMEAQLSGARLEYVVIQLYTAVSGRREAELGFHVGQGTQDIGFRNTTHYLFKILPAVKVSLDIRDEKGSPVMAGLMITDGIERKKGRLYNVYPLPSRRVASLDEYPDFFFQKQIYRKDGEHVFLPPGKYRVSVTRGPEYRTDIRELIVPADTREMTLVLRPVRWIDPSSLGWHSGDHHVHAAGCSHYDSPEEGVPPAHMYRQAKGEDLDVSAVLTWGPSWYAQKKYFTGKDHPLSDDQSIIRYDVEVSGFPSSHTGHVVLLQLKEDDYPGTSRIEEWPSWTLPVLEWAKGQGAATGYAHSGWGLEPENGTKELPNLAMPKMDGIGANEYVVTATKGLVDFYSLGDTPLEWELNMWYHTLNCGLKVMASGETDFPCITDQRVGLSRSYFRSDRQVDYDTYVNALRSGASYVSDGYSHLMDFSVNGQKSGESGNTLQIRKGDRVTITASAASFLDRNVVDPLVSLYAEKSFWDISRARVGETQQVKAELIVNGEVADTLQMEADGTIRQIRFDYEVTESAWVALRILGSAHTNPVFLEVGGKPVVVNSSAKWCAAAVEQCWKKKNPGIRENERPAAEAAYREAKAWYEKLLSE